MPFVVVYDACVLFPNTLRDLLIRLALADLVQAKWTLEIQAEMRAALMSRRPGITDDKLAVLCTRMNAAVPDCLVEGYEGMADGLKLPDNGDRHVVAAAVKCGAQVIVTSNLKDFPTDELARFGIEARSPDDFLLDQIDIDDRVVWSCLQEIANTRTHPPESLDDVMAQLTDSGLILSMAALWSS